MDDILKKKKKETKIFCTGWLDGAFNRTSAREQWGDHLWVN